MRQQRGMTTGPESFRLPETSIGKEGRESLKIKNKGPKNYKSTGRREDALDLKRKMVGAKAGKTSIGLPRHG